MTTDNPDQPAVRDEKWNARVARHFSRIVATRQPLDQRFTEELLQEARMHAATEMLDEIHLMLRNINPRVLPEIRQQNLALQRRSNELLDEKAKLISVIHRCERQFQFYVEQHRAKDPPDEAKARRNAVFVELCRSVL